MPPSPPCRPTLRTSSRASKASTIFLDRSYHVSKPADLPAFTSGKCALPWRLTISPPSITSTALYQAGIDGTGQKIAIIGRTDINVADVRAFRARLNLPVNDPQVVLVGPDPGINTTDQNEAYLDLEWAGAIARNATIIYVNSTNERTSRLNMPSMQNLATVMTYSYGNCEQQVTPTRSVSVAQQAAAQGHHLDGFRRG